VMRRDYVAGDARDRRVFRAAAAIVATLWAHYQGGDVDAGLAELGAPAGAMIDDLLWWTTALNKARAGAS
jgi:hypothetical protein